MEEWEENLKKYLKEKGDLQGMTIKRLKKERMEISILILIFAGTLIFVLAPSEMKILKTILGSALGIAAVLIHILLVKLKETNFKK